MDYYFEIKKLSVGYDGQPLIRDIEVGVEKGKILTLIGPNGSGKSTILRSITRQLKKLAGVVLIDAQSIDDMSDRQLSKRLSVVLTEKLQTELLTCEDVTATGRYPYTGRLGVLKDEDRQKVHSAMKLMQVDELRDRDFMTISDGQRQRVMLARAICQEPDIIVLDEPTSYLDIKHKIKLLTILRSLVRSSGVTVVMSLHEIDLAQKVSDYIMCVKGEYIQNYGTPEKIFNSNFISNLYELGSSRLDRQADASADSVTSGGVYNESDRAADNKTGGVYNAFFGSVELPSAAGPPEVFVIAGGACGSTVFRRLQREGIPFAAGILHQGDADCMLALDMGAEVVAEDAFQLISAETYGRAEALMLQCRSVICCLKEFGPVNEANQRLLQKAKATNLLIQPDGL